MEILQKVNIYVSGSCWDIPVSCYLSKETIGIEFLPKLNIPLLKFNSECFIIDTKINESVRRLTDGRL